MSNTKDPLPKLTKADFRQLTKLVAEWQREALSKIDPWQRKLFFYRELMSKNIANSASPKIKALWQAVSNAFEAMPEEDQKAWIIDWQPWRAVVEDMERRL